MLKYRYTMKCITNNWFIKIINKKIDGCGSPIKVISQELVNVVR